MSCLYVTEQGAEIRENGGRIMVVCKDGSERSLPIETLESIMLFGGITLTAKAQQKCLEKGISVTLLSNKGYYFGRLVSTSHVNTIRLKKQINLTDNENECLKLARKIQKAKIHNQIVLAKRYTRNADKDDYKEQIHSMEIAEKKIDSAVSVEQVIGYEGTAARTYFSILSDIISEDFKFNGRNRRPPKDPFNSMLSLGYTILLYEIYAEVEARSLDPYFGFIHQLKENHPALASDLLEEWRAVIVDSTVLSLIQGNEIHVEDFNKDPDTGAVVLNHKALSVFIRKLENKMRSGMNYLSYLDNPTTFRRAIWWQVQTFAVCIDNENFDNYRPVRIR